MIANLLSFVILIPYFYGRSLARRSPARHAKWMTGVICGDYALILYLAGVRRVLGKIRPEMTWQLKVHLCFAITSAALYLVAIGLGLMSRRGHSVRRQMVWLDRVLTPARVATSFTSLLVHFA